MNSKEEKMLSKRGSNMFMSKQIERPLNQPNYPSKDICPECGERTFMQGRCPICMRCGWSPCG